MYRCDDNIISTLRFSMSSSRAALSRPALVASFHPLLPRVILLQVEMSHIILLYIILNALKIVCRDLTSPTTLLFLITISPELVFNTRDFLLHVTMLFCVPQVTEHYHSVLWYKRTSSSETERIIIYKKYNKTLVRK